MRRKLEDRGSIRVVKELPIHVFLAQACEFLVSFLLQRHSSGVDIRLPRKGRARGEHLAYSPLV